MQNIFDHLPHAPLTEELFEILANGHEFNMSRIISTGQVSPQSGWYDQDTHEWVILLKGAAIITFEDGREIHFAPGDYLMIPAHDKHRVSWTKPDRQSVWLAIYYR